jgi:hypothetical protein
LEEAVPLLRPNPELAWRDYGNPPEIIRISCSLTESLFQALSKDGVYIFIAN